MNIQELKRSCAGKNEKRQKQASQLSHSLWDISVEEDVSSFYLEFGALDIFVELFSNPNHRFESPIFPDLPCNPVP